MAFTFALKKGAEEIIVNGFTDAGELRLVVGGVHLGPFHVPVRAPSFTVPCLRLKKGQKVEITFTPSGAGATPEIVEQTVPGGKSEWIGANVTGLISCGISLSVAGFVIWFALSVTSQIGEIAKGAGSGSGTSASVPTDPALLARITALESKPAPVAAIDPALAAKVVELDRLLNGFETIPTPVPVRTPGLAEILQRMDAKLDGLKGDFDAYKTSHP